MRILVGRPEHGVTTLTFVPARSKGQRPVTKHGVTLEEVGEVVLKTLADYAGTTRP